MITNVETVKYDLSADKKGLMLFGVARHQDGKEKEITYHVHSDELTRLEKWIHGLLLDRAKRKGAA